MRIITLAVLATSLGLAGGCATTDGQGHAKVDCLAQVDGSVADCRIVAEEPPNVGFGAAAIEVTSQMKVNHLPNRPVRFQTIVRFRLAPDGTPLMQGRQASP